MFSEPLGINLAVQIVILLYVIELISFKSSMTNRMIGFNITTIIVLLMYSLPWSNPVVGFILILVAWALSIADIFHHKKDNYTFLFLNWVEFITLSISAIIIATNMIKAL
ncbi:MAG: hypothetical protein UR96_C0005G0032 [candidate division WS6 bacterium GW2011_GWC1_36_11]|uniref:Uncharacterized protein n=1 Tax=candidate division WS6 bacterium GW2011_GWC1_36_11 TaxID=1619090 RepID=A0A0G0DH94_9BACT|nr:MAG: hypothetical protein UR96_C0005G0032 [candidate division WS6 bacterium GW2011_GWC1_36_11]